MCIDDATRVAYAEVLPDERAVTSTGFVERAIAWFRDRDVHVERVMTDNAPCYYAHRFNRALAAHGVRHVYTRPYRPQTNGKAERFIRTAKNEWAYARAYKTSAVRTRLLSGFLNRYNRRRPHRGIGNVTPLCRLETLL